MIKKESKIYFHGTSDKNVSFSESKAGKGYHVGAGPVEFLGPSFSSSREVALSYGRNIEEKKIEIRNPRKLRSMEALRKNIVETFGLPSGKTDLSEWYREIAENYRIKLQAEGYDAVIFPEGGKYHPKTNLAETVIPLDPGQISEAE